MDFLISDQTEGLTESVGSSWEDIHVIKGPLEEESSVGSKE